MTVAYFRGDLKDMWHGVSGEGDSLSGHTTDSDSHEHNHDNLVLDDSIQIDGMEPEDLDTELVSLNIQESESSSASLIKTDTHHTT